MIWILSSENWNVVVVRGVLYYRFGLGARDPCTSPAYMPLNWQMCFSWFCVFEHNILTLYYSWMLFPFSHLSFWTLPQQQESFVCDFSHSFIFTVVIAGYDNTIAKFKQYHLIITFACNWLESSMYEGKKQKNCERQRLIQCSLELFYCFVLF